MGIDEMRRQVLVKFNGSPEKVPVKACLVQRDEDMDDAGIIIGKSQDLQLPGPVSEQKSADIAPHPRQGKMQGLFY
ncbi:MAG: hypothetical protein WCF90_04600 [Methanomicrobiales archaeon]